VARVLVVSNRTLGALEIVQALSERLARDRLVVHIVVPVDPGLAPQERDRAVEEARGRLDDELARLAALGAEVDGELTVGDPVGLARDVVAAGGFDEVLVCSLPRGVSRWLRAGTKEELGSSLGVPVVALTAPAGLPSRMRTTAVRLTVYVGESDTRGGRPLYTEIVHRARDMGLAGATVLRGLEGFGAGQVVHITRLLTFSEDLPMVVVIIDGAERVDAFLPVLDELIDEGLLVREEIEVVRYAGGSPG